MGENTDTALIRLVIAKLVEEQNLKYEEALDKFYNSKVCELISNEDTGVFTYAPYDIYEMLQEELNLK